MHIKRFVVKRHDFKSYIWKSNSQKYPSHATKNKKYHKCLLQVSQEKVIPQINNLQSFLHKGSAELYFSLTILKVKNNLKI